MTKEQIIEIMAKAIVGYFPCSDRPATVDEIRAAARASYESVESAGLVIVPREPSEDICKATWGKARVDDIGIDEETAAEVYRAMISAIPTHKGEKG